MMAHCFTSKLHPTHAAGIHDERFAIQVEQRIEAGVAHIRVSQCYHRIITKSINLFELVCAETVAPGGAAIWPEISTRSCAGSRSRQMLTTKWRLVGTWLVFETGCRCQIDQNMKYSVAYAFRSAAYVEEIRVL